MWIASAIANISSEFQKCLQLGMMVDKAIASALQQAAMVSQVSE